jgi:hypothetical protein
MFFDSNLVNTPKIMKCFPFIFNSERSINEPISFQGFRLCDSLKIVKFHIGAIYIKIYFYLLRLPYYLKNLIRKSILRPKIDYSVIAFRMYIICKMHDLLRKDSILKTQTAKTGIISSD